MAGSVLNEEQQAFVVKALACFDTPSTVAAAVKEEFGVTISRQAVYGYDPTKSLGSKQLASKWRELFHKTRDKFIKDTSEIPIAHRATRVHRLNRMSEAAEARGNMPLAASLMEQAAKEMGDSYSNRREITGANGGPIRTASIDMSKLSDTALAEIVAAGDAAEDETDQEK